MADFLGFLIQMTLNDAISRNTLSFKSKSRQNKLFKHETKSVLSNASYLRSPVYSRTFFLAYLKISKLLERCLSISHLNSVSFGDKCEPRAAGPIADSTGRVRDRTRQPGFSASLQRGFYRNKLANTFASIQEVSRILMFSP
ncbi:hypothetical protein BDQ17DRAFT_236972 [Cyathus striatus]|nr:hypothetical protein BDQ17DRAFT_236972 [Cyathus striatus]